MASRVEAGTMLSMNSFWIAMECLNDQWPFIYISANKRRNSRKILNRLQLSFPPSRTSDEV